MSTSSSSRAVDESATADRERARARLRGGRRSRHDGAADPRRARAPRRARELGRAGAFAESVRAAAAADRLDLRRVPAEDRRTAARAGAAPAGAGRFHRRRAVARAGPDATHDAGALASTRAPLPDPPEDGGRRARGHDPGAATLRSEITRVTACDVPRARAGALPESRETHPG